MVLMMQELQARRLSLATAISSSVVIALALFLLAYPRPIPAQRALQYSFVLPLMRRGKFAFSNPVLSDLRQQTIIINPVTHYEFRSKITLFPTGMIAPKSTRPP